MKVPCGGFSLSGLDELRLSRCTRGWLIESGGQQSGLIGSRFAFDRIEDVADFLVTTFTPNPLSEGNEQ